MTDLELQEQAEKSWEKINSELPNGVNPTAYMYGFKSKTKGFSIAYFRKRSS